MSSEVTWDGYARGWSARHGGQTPHRSSAVGRWLRVAYTVARFLNRLRIRPTAVTFGRVVLNAAVPALVFADGYWLVAAGATALLAALGDSVDGALALLQSRSSRLGFYYDAIADRLAEVCWSLALWVAGAPGWLVVAALSVSWLHEYARLALLSVTGRQAVSPFGERPTRVLAVFFGLTVAGLVPQSLSAGVVTVAAAGWLIFNTMGLVLLLRLGQRALR